MLEPKAAAKAAAAGVTGDADIRRLEMDVSERLGARVRLEHSAKGMGRVVISYNSLDELDGILKHIK
jgi:ParB family chromosome partitioning protein